MIKAFRKWQQSKSRKGFTLIELLIVIAIIAALAGVVGLSATSSTARGDAAKIVSDLKVAKTASALYYADNKSWPNDKTSLDIYLDQSLKGTWTFTVNTSGSSNDLDIKYTVSGDNKANIIKALTKISSDAGITAMDDDSVTVNVK